MGIENNEQIKGLEGMMTEYVTGAAVYDGMWKCMQCNVDGKMW